MVWYNFTGWIEDVVTRYATFATFFAVGCRRYFCHISRNSPPTNASAQRKLEEFGLHHFVGFRVATSVRRPLLLRSRIRGFIHLPGGRALFSVQYAAHCPGNVSLPDHCLCRRKLDLL